MPIIPKGGSSRKAKEAAAAAAQAAAVAASAASAASVQVRILLDDGTSNILMRSIDGRSEPVLDIFLSIYGTHVVPVHALKFGDCSLYFCCHLLIYLRHIQNFPCFFSNSKR
jgi:hypothetical protein